MKILDHNKKDSIDCINLHQSACEIIKQCGKMQELDPHVLKLKEQVFREGLPPHHHPHLPVESRAEPDLPLCLQGYLAPLSR